MKDSVKIITKSDRDTKRAGKLFAKTVQSAGKRSRALVISLEGDLGSGKTTFTKGFAEGLGIKDMIQSPTFVILKIYQRNTFKRSRKSVASHNLFKNLIHIDAHRIFQKDLKVLGWKEFIKNPHNILLVEWGERLKKSLPKDAIHIKFFHEKSLHIRRIQFEQ